MTFYLKTRLFGAFILLGLTLTAHAELLIVQAKC